MPEKPLTIATYAAGASLAAITLVYVFGPTFFIDGNAASNSASNRKKGVVGLVNYANDCFINSVLQALAGLGDLREFLIRETHRRTLDGKEVYRVDLEATTPDEKIKVDPRKLEGLQRGIVTQALKDVIDGLNERPLYRKTISAGPFLAVLEDGYRQKISRRQQDAQEFLQIITERLSDEYYAGRKARRKAAALIDDEAAGRLSQDEKPGDGPTTNGAVGEPKSTTSSPPLAKPSSEADPSEEGFPFEGALASQIECQTCHFQPKPSTSTFVTLTLNVPQSSSTTLNHCFDGLLKTESIDGFKCDACRLQHALESLQRDLSRATSDTERSTLTSHISSLQTALHDDPEKPPPSVPLPDIKSAPKRRISRHVRITTFPRILAIHLSRSIYDPRSYSTKNSAKVSFPEQLPLGGLMERKRYKLLGVVTHKGSHDSGHYETFRRQTVQLPFSTPHVKPTAGGVYSATPTPSSSVAPSPQFPTISSSATGTNGEIDENPPSTPSSTALDPSHLPSPPSEPETSSLTPPGSSSSTHLTPPSPHHRPRSSSSQSSSSRKHSATQGPTSAPRQSTESTTTTAPDPSSTSLNPSHRPPSAKPSSSPSKPSTPSKPPSRRTTLTTPFRRSTDSAPNNDRWYRISDERVKESRTTEVLSMQREVYLLFYERVD